MDPAKAQELKDIHARKVEEDPAGMRARKKAYDAARYAAKREELLAQGRERRANLTPDQRERRRVQQAAYRNANRERIREYMRSQRRIGYFREWRAKQRAENPAYLPRQRLVRTAHRYGITPERYEDMFAAQDGRCAICKLGETMLIRGTRAALAVDHDRRCCAGKRSCGACVRGLLCVRCNMSLGGVREDPETLRAMADYIETYADAERGARAAS